MWKAVIYESERGWGTKIDEIKSFDTKEERDEFMHKFNAKNTDLVAPDWYMIAYPMEEVA